MEVKQNELLSKYTTFRMGGVAKEMFFPEDTNDLGKLFNDNSEAFDYVIGGGSNLLINDKKEYEKVICLRKLNNQVEYLGKGRYYIGASIRLQKAIKEINKDGYGGIEYLYSVPGLVGGAIYMNAGRGAQYNKSISDYIVSVDIFINGNIKKMPREECGFKYRHSIFQTMPRVIILGAEFLFPEISQEEAQKRIEERLDLCRKVQDMSAPNFGTVFCHSNRYIMRIVRKIGMGYKDGCSFSRKTQSWMLKGENGSFEQAINLLNRVEKIHFILGLRIEREVKVWE